MDGSFERLRFPVAAPPPVGETLPIAPGVWWLRMPLPFALDHINLWLLEDGPGWTIVDTGYALPETRAAWERIFAEHLAAPLIAVGAINERLDAVEFYVDRPEVRAALRERLKHCPDIERALTRLSLGRGPVGPAARPRPYSSSLLQLPSRMTTDRGDLTLSRLASTAYRAGRRITSRQPFQFS